MPELELSDADRHRFEDLAASGVLVQAEVERLRARVEDLKAQADAIADERDALVAGHNSRLLRALADMAEVHGVELDVETDSPRVEDGRLIWAEAKG